MEAKPHEVTIIQADDGHEPFADWLRELDARTKAIVLQRIDRVEKGNFGDYKSVGDSVFELRIDFGPGYRVYYALRDRQVNLLGGGRKRQQQRDIDRAKKLWSGQNAQNTFIQ